MQSFLIFLSSKKYLAKFFDIVNDASKQDKNITLVLSPEINELDIPKIKNISYKNFSDYETDKHKSDFCAIDARTLLRSWGDLKLKEGLFFEDLTLYKGKPLLKIYDNAILSYYLIELIYYIKIASTIIEQEKPDQLFILGSKNKTVSKVFFEVAKQKNISTYLSNPLKEITFKLIGSPIVFQRAYFFGPFEFLISFPFGIYNFGLFLKNSFHTVSAKIYNLKMKSRECYSKKILFFITNKKQSDYVIPLVREIEKGSKISALLVDWYGKSGDAINFLKSRKLFHKVFDGYTTFEINKMHWQVNRAFLKNWNSIENNQEFQKSFQYQGFFLWNLIAPYLKELFLRHFFKAIRIYEIAQRLFNIERPEMIIVTNEREYNARMCILAAKNKKILSLAMLRELLGDFPDPDSEPPFYTDKVIIDGKYMYEILVRRGENPDKLIISSSPRWDEVFLRRSHPQKDLISGRLNISSNKKIVVLTTTFLNPFLKIDEYERLIKGACQAFKNLSSYQLVIKLHPRDPNEKLVNRLCREIGIKNITIIKDVDMFDLISTSDLLITSYSTTGLEAIAMDKPVIIANLSRTRSEMAPFVSSGAALGVFREQDITPAIKEILENKQTQERLRIAREKFLAEHIQDFDGLTTKKFVELIRNMLSQNIKK